MNLAGQRVLGREAFAAAMGDAMASPLSDVLTTIEIVDIRRPIPALAIVSCIKTVHDRRPVADVSTTFPSTGALTYVMTRAGDAWRIAVAQTTPIVSAPHRP